MVTSQKGKDGGFGRAARHFFKRTFGKKPGTIVFNTLLYLFFLLITVIMLYPFLYVLIKSLQTRELIEGESQIVLTLAAYGTVLDDSSYITAFVTTIVVLVIKVVLALLISFMIAYPLSKHYFKGRKFYLVFLMITMLFSGGMIPNYILITQVLEWRNSYLVYIFPGLVGAYNVFVIKSFLQGIPDSLEEAALLDGANPFVILFFIYVPLSGPIMATIGLWVGVSVMNNWMSGVLYITDANKRLIQNLLRDILLTASSTDVGGWGGDSELMAMAENVKMASIVIGILPIVIMYPFVQKYFIKGMLVGSVKG